MSQIGLESEKKSNPESNSHKKIDEEIKVNYIYYTGGTI